MTAMTIDLSGHRLLITGASGVLGRALALRCAGVGAELILLARRKARLEALDDEIAALGGPPPLLVELDFHRANEGHYQELARALGTSPGLDGLIIASGAHTGLHPLDHLPDRDWQQIMNVNLHGPFRLMRALLPALRDCRGHIVAATPPVDVSRKAFWGAYGVSHAGFAALLAIMAEENEGRIDVASVEMEPMASPMRGLIYPGENPADLPPLQNNIDRILDRLQT